MPTQIGLILQVALSKVILGLYTGTRFYHITSVVASVTELVWRSLNIRYSIRYIFDQKYPQNTRMYVILP